MKYLITIVLASILLASPAQAITIGGGANVDCKINYDSTNPNEVGHKCTPDQEQFKRLVELETAVIELQQKNAVLQAQINSLQSNQPGMFIVDGTLPGRMDNLEARMAKVEAAMDGLNQWVRDVFAWVGKILKIKIL